MIVWGTRLFGRTDEVPGYFVVATVFFHIWYIPLVPIQSYLVLEDNGQSWRGVPIQFNLRSILLAYGRTIAGGVGVITLVGVLLGQQISQDISYIAGLLICIFSWALCIRLKFVRSYRFASLERARQLFMLVSQFAQERDPGAQERSGASAQPGTHAESRVQTTEPLAPEIYYKLLGLRPEETTTTTINEAYRRAAINNHPDKCKQDPYATERFKLLQEAYEVLMSAHSRAMPHEIATKN